MPAVTRTASATASATDVELLKGTLCHLLDMDPTTFDTHPIAKALARSGITGFKAKFLGFPPSYIDKMEYMENPTDTHPTELGLCYKAQLRAVLAFYHHYARLNGGGFDMRGIDRNIFNEFRISEYDPDARIIPHGRPDPTATKVSSELSNWRKMIKPNKSDYKEFRDPVFWQQSKESIITTLKAQGMHHLVDRAHTVTDPLLDEAQRDWFYKVLQDIMVAPSAKKIVKKNLSTKDTRMIWKEICEKHDNSMTALNKSRQISTYLTSIRFKDMNWRGTQQSWILHYYEQVRLYNMINPSDHFSETQLITFLEAALVGVDNLANVYQTDKACRLAAGSTTSASWDEYISLLQLQAEIYDNAHKNVRNPRSQRETNEHEILFEEPTAEPQLEAEMHDVDTDIEQLLVMQNESSSRNGNSGQYHPRSRTRMTKETWDSLQKNDQVTWDKLSDEGKSKILNYAYKRGNQMNAKTTQKISVKTHEQDSGPLFETDPPSQEEPQVEVSTHQLVERPQEPEPVKDLLDLSDDTKEDAEPKQTFSIHQLLSQPSKNNISSNSHEVILPRSDYTPEAFVHEINFGGMTLWVESDDEEETPGTTGDDDVPPPLVPNTQNDADLLNLEDVSTVPKEAHSEQSVGLTSYLSKPYVFNPDDFKYEPPNEEQEETKPSPAKLSLTKTPMGLAESPKEWTNRTEKDQVAKQKVSESGEEKMSGKFRKVTKPKPTLAERIVPSSTEGTKHVILPEPEKKEGSTETPSPAKPQAKGSNETPDPDSDSKSQPPVAVATPKPEETKPEETKPETTAVVAPTDPTQEEPTEATIPPKAQGTTDQQQDTTETLSPQELLDVLKRSEEEALRNPDVAILFSKEYGIVLSEVVGFIKERQAAADASNPVHDPNDVMLQIDGASVPEPVTTSEEEHGDIPALIDDLGRIVITQGSPQGTSTMSEPKTTSDEASMQTLSSDYVPSQTGDSSSKSYEIPKTRSSKDEEETLVEVTLTPTKEQEKPSVDVTATAPNTGKATPKKDDSSWATASSKRSKKKNRRGKKNQQVTPSQPTPPAATQTPMLGQLKSICTLISPPAYQHEASSEEASSGNSGGNSPTGTAASNLDTTSPLQDQERDFREGKSD